LSSFASVTKKAVSEGLVWFLVHFNTMWINK
jgi:hypothetical protein